MIILHLFGLFDEIVGKNDVMFLKFGKKAHKNKKQKTKNKNKIKKN